MAAKSYHVYADANIYLDFFRFTDDDLNQLEKFITHISDAGVELYLPQLTQEEYQRNRDKVVVEQISLISRFSLKFGLPVFIRDLASAKEFSKNLQEAASARSKLLEEAEKLATTHSYKADNLIFSLFAAAHYVPTSEDLVARARLRSDLRNPPGKPDSIGDRLNWECLLESMPHGKDLHLITRDGDFLADFKEKTANLFLIQEWKRTKNSSIIVHSNIKSFASFVDSAIQFANDPAKLDAIAQLASSPSYYSTHVAVATLSEHLDKLTESDCERLLKIALENNQVGGILSDDDLKNFYLNVRKKLPWFGSEIGDAFDDVFGDITVPF